MQTRLSRLLDLALPIVQAPMAGVSTPALAAAVTGAGGLGSISVGAVPAAEADRLLAAAVPVCGGRLNVNVFCHAKPRVDPEREKAWLRTLEPLFREFDAEPPRCLEEIYPTFADDREMLDVLTAHRPAVVSFHFGLPAGHVLGTLRSSGACLFATATSIAEARLAEAAGIDVVIAQGFEAGGHRGTFDGKERDDCLSTFTLLPRIVASVDIPVLAAGGITNGRAILAALAMGAAGVQMGSAFVDCPESAAGDAYRRAIRAADRRTVMTRLFSGRPARGLENRFVRELGDWEHEVPAYPRAYHAAKQLAAAATARGSHELTAMWVGQGPPREDTLPAAELVRRLGEEAAESRAS